MKNSNGTILIVDDKKDFREYLGEILEAERYRVLLAGSEGEALESIRKCKLNLVLLDLKLTESDDLDGMRVLSEALRIKPRLQIIIITGYGTIQTAIEATRMGAYDFIEKPIDNERLLLAIERAIERDSMMTNIEALKKIALEKYEMIGTSPVMNSVYELMEKTAPTNAKVLITGETGVGKELVAGAIHQLSPRAAKPFVKVNCSAIPTDLIESELFGIGEGVASGVQGRRGKFEQAQGGTMFLDEIGDMSATTQTKVLRVLDKGEFYTVGGTEEIKVDVRVIAATNKELEREIEKGTFREDLFYRLNTITIPVPPLRERRDDIPLLLDHFLHFYCDENNVLLKKFALDALLFLKSYEWKGNVRELKSLVEKLVILTESEMIGRLQVLDALKKTPVRTWTYQVETLQEMRERTEREHISYVLRSCNGNITNAAIILDLNRVNLYRKMKKYGMERGTGGSRQ